MSRSGYSDDCDGWALIRWRGAVKSAIKGVRGQAFLRELLSALDAMPTKRLIDGDLESNGEVCALGSVGRRRGINQSEIDTYDRDALAQTFGIAGAMAAEIMFENDQGTWYAETAEHRWERMRAWVAAQIIVAPQPEQK